MEDGKEADEYITLEEIPRRDSPASAPTPSGECPSAVTEDADIDQDILTGDDPNSDNNLDGPSEPQDDRDSPSLRELSPSIRLSRELNASDSDDGDGFSGGEAGPNPAHAKPRIIAVTPLPGNPSPDIKSDHDSGVKIDNDDDDEGGSDSKAPEKRNPTPSLASSEVSSRGGSPDVAEPYEPAAKKGGSSQPPRFKNDVEPAEYHRPAAPAYNRAVHSLQCKAMLIIMAASIIAVLLVIGFIILNGGSDDEHETTLESLDGSFNITNRLYESTYEDSGSNDYRQLSEEFISTMNATFQNSGRYDEFYDKTAVHRIDRANNSTPGATIRPLINFTISLLIEDSDLMGRDSVTTDSPSVTGSSLVSGPTPGTTPAAVVDSIINYLLNVTESGNFGNFTGEMVFRHSV